MMVDSGENLIKFVKVSADVICNKSQNGQEDKDATKGFQKHGPHKKIIHVEMLLSEGLNVVTGIIHAFHTI